MEYGIIIAIAIIIITLIVNDYKRYKHSYYSQITNHSYLAIHFNAGISGEYSLYKRIQSFEKIGCKFLFNLYIPHKNGATSEIDIVMLHPKGLFVIESKNYSGWIFGKEYQKQWVETFPNGDKYRFYNPIMQNATHIRAVRKIVNDRIPIYSIIAFSDQCTLKDVTIKSDIIVTYYNSLALNISHKLNSLTHNDMSTELFNETYSKLYQYSQADDLTKAQHLQNLY